MSVRCAVACAVLALTGPACAEDLQPSAAAQRAAELAAQPVAPVAAPPRVVAQPFDLMALDVGPSAHLPRDVVAGLVGRLTGHRYASRSAAETAVIAAFDAAFVARGQVLAASYVDATASGPNRIALRFVEARTGRVQVTGQGAARDTRYFRFILGLADGVVIDSAAMNAQVQRLAQSDGTQLRLAYAPGAAAGTSDVTIDVAQPARPKGFATLDNMGEASRGTARLSFGWRVPSLTGFADPLLLTATGSQGGTSLTAIYGRPVDTAGGVISLTATVEDSRTLTAPQIDSTSAMAELGYTRPLWQGENATAGLSAGIMAFADQSDFAGLAIKDQRGVAARLGLNLMQRWENGGLVFAPALRLTRLSDVVAGQSGQRRAQLIGTLSAQMRWPDRIRADLSASWQYAFDANTPARFQFAAAGPTAVRGYRAGGSSGDSGYVLRLNVSADKPVALGQGAMLTPFAFADLGEAFDRDASGTTTGLGRLASIGFGATVTLEHGLTASFTYARPLQTAAGAKAGEPSLIAALTMTF